jgi:flavin-dependent dehydrogenase
VRVRDAEVIVVGAGPAGLATALELAKRGVAPFVIERRRPPLDKACGEGIMPAGVRALEELGVALPTDRCTRFRGIRFLDGRRSFEGEFSAGHGIGARRTVLSEALLERTRSAGIPVEFGCSLRAWESRAGGVFARTSAGDVRARLLIGADGLRSFVRSRAGLDGRRRGRRVGLRRHFRVAPWSHLVEVYWSDGAEAYVTPVAADEVGVAMLWGGDGGSYERRLAAFPQLEARLRGAEPVTSVRGAGPFWQGARRRFAPGVALVGDAAGYTDAVTGEGITLSLVCARALAEVVAERRPLADYERAWRKLTRMHRAFATLLVFGVRHPRARAAVFAVLARRPHLFERMLGVAAGERPAERRFAAGAKASMDSPPL